MPLTQPRKVTEIQDWLLVKEDSHLILEKKLPVKKAFSQATHYRILLKFNRQQVAQAANEKDIFDLWNQLQPTAEVHSFVQVHAIQYAPDHLFALIDQLYKKELEEIGTALKPTPQDEAEYLANIYAIVQELKTIYEHEGTNRLADESTRSLIGMLCLVSRSCLDCSKKLLLKRLMRTIIDNRDSSTEILGTPGPDAIKNEFVNDLELRTHFVDNVNKLYTTETKLNEDLLNINNRIKKIEHIPTKAFTRDAVFYVPVIDEVNKAFDSQFLDQLLGNDAATSDVELEEKVFEYFDQVFMQMQDPITVAVRNTSKLLEGRLREKMIRAGKLLASPTNNSNLKLSLSQSGDVSSASVIDDLKEDVAQLLEIFKASFQLSFPNLCKDSGRVLNVIKYVLGDIFAANLHALLLEYYKSVNGEKDNIASLKCAEFKKQASFDKIGINKKYWDALKDQNAVNDISKFGVLFVKTNSIIKKLRFLDQMATQLCQHAAGGLKGKKQESIGADDFLPLVTYIMIQANIPFIYSELEFIADFIPETHLLGKNGYLLVSVQAAMHHVLIMDTIEARDLARSDSRRSSVVSNTSDDQKLLIAPIVTQLAASGRHRGSSASESELPPTPEGSRMNFDDDSNSGSSPTPNTQIDQLVGNGNNSLNILNSEPNGQEPTNDPEQAINLSIKLISCVISIYKKHCRNFNVQSTKDFKAAAEAIHEDEFYRAFVSDTSQLHTVTAVGLNEQQKLVFFVNIYHTLLLHSFVEMDSIPDSNFSKISHARSVGYIIGGIAVSLLAVEHEILRAHSHRPSFFGSSFLISKSSPRGSSITSLALAESHPQISFLLATLSKSGPPVRVLTMENIEAILHHAAFFYLNSEVKIDKKVITLPKLVDWYKKDFGSSTTSVLKWLALYLTTDKNNQITQLLHSNSYRIAFKSYDYNFKFESESPDQATLDQASNHYRTGLAVQLGDGPVVK